MRARRERDRPSSEWSGKTRVLHVGVIGRNVPFTLNGLQRLPLLEQVWPRHTRVTSYLGEAQYPSKGLKSHPPRWALAPAELQTLEEY